MANLEMPANRNRYLTVRIKATLVINVFVPAN